MKFFVPLGLQHYECVNMVDDSDYEVLLTLDRCRREAPWRPLRVRRVRADHRQGCKPSDFPWLGAHALILRERSVNALCDLLLSNGELVELQDEQQVPLMLFIPQAIDALDVARSEIKYFSDGLHIMDIPKVSFIAERVRRVDLFRLPMRRSDTYVSERFVERVNAAKLTGIEFHLAWEGD